MLVTPGTICDLHLGLEPLDLFGDIQESAVEQRVSLGDPGDRPARLQLGQYFLGGPAVIVARCGSVARHANRRLAEFLLGQFQRRQDGPRKSCRLPSRTRDNKSARPTAERAPL